MICHVIRFCTGEEQHSLNDRIFAVLDLLKKACSILLYFSNSVC